MHISGRDNRLACLYGLNVIYDEDGYKYANDDGDRIYVPLEEQNVAEDQ